MSVSPRPASSPDRSQRNLEARYPKDLLVVTDGVGAELFIARAAAIAKALAARLSVIVVAPAPDPSRYKPHADAEQLGRDSAAIAQAAKKRLDGVKQALHTTREATAHLVVADLPELASLIAIAARHAELALVPGDYACGNQTLRAELITAMLDQAACPVLIVRDRAASLPACKTIVAWNGSRACSRAWRDATRIVQPGSRVEIGIGGVIAATKVCDTQLSRLTSAYFERQGYSAQVHELPLHPSAKEWRTPAERLMEFEARFDPDLIVMGAGQPPTNAYPGLSALTLAMIGSGKSHLLVSR